jgi:hypothetical protein
LLTNAAFSAAAVGVLQSSLYGFDFHVPGAATVGALAANFLLSFGWAALWTALVPRRAVALTLAGLPIALLAVANARKVVELSEPLLVFDLFAARNLPVLIGYLSRSEIASIALGVVVASFVIAGSVRGRASSRPPVIVSLAAFGIASVVGQSLADPSDSWAKRAFGTLDIYWDPLEQYRTNGFVVAALLELSHLGIEVPARYEEGRERQLLEPYLQCSDESAPLEAPRHVVLALLEFDKDPLRFYHELRSRAALRHLVSPVFGGRTANAEFEVLTSLSTQFWPAGSIPYQQYLKRPVESVASVFRERGYRTVAVHNFHRRFWNRDVVYPNLGFDEYVALEDFGDVPWELGWPSDGAVFDRVEAILRDADRPTFVFAITVGTHGPYARHDIEPTVHLVDESVPELSGPLSVYASKLALLDGHLEKFVAGLDDLPNPPIVMAFSDHLPTVASRSIGSHEFGAPPRSRVVESLVWGTPDVAPDPGPRSLNCLGPELLRLAGIDPPPFFRFVEDLCATVPVVGSGVASQRDSELVENYRWLNYDRLFGAGYSGRPCSAT